MTQARAKPTANPPTVQLGDLTITLLDGGHLSLDGGAMFGIIPKPVWSKLVEVDEANRIPLAMTCFLVETGGRRVLVETGAGTPADYAEKEQGFFLLADHWVVDSLEAIGIERESIDFVIPTHLHFDHAGGCTMPDGRGGHVPTFPNAQYIIQRGEWDDAATGHCVMTATYREQNMAPLEKAGVVSRVDGEAEIAPGIMVTPLVGHTRHQQGVVFDGGEGKAVLPGDLLPTAAHVGLRFNMGYDLLPFENMRTKERLLADASAGGWTLLLGQDPGQVAWRVAADDRGRFALSPSE